MARPRGFLKSVEGIYPLSPKITTIGREGCDFIIQNGSVDLQHATVEFSEVDDAFILKDLDTSQGTYVNDCRVQNAAVRLAVGDSIKFGNTGVVYELATDAPSQAPVYASMSQRGGWQQQQQQVGSTLPSISPGHVISPALPTWVTSQPQQHLPRSLPSPSNGSGSSTIRLTGRPLSAGSARRGGQPPLPPSAVSAGNSGPQSIHSNRGGGWVSGPIKNAGSPGQITPATTDMALLQEKEQRISILQSEVDRLQHIELEITSRDSMIDQLRSQQTQLQAQMGTLADPDLRNRLSHLEQEVSIKRVEVQQLQDQLYNAQQQQQLQRSGSAAGSEAGLRQELTTHQTELLVARGELEKSRKDKQITSGLVTQLQRDLSNKDATISRLTREIETLKKDMNERDVTISAMQAKDNKYVQTEWSKLSARNDQCPFCDCSCFTGYNRAGSASPGCNSGGSTYRLEECKQGSFNRVKEGKRADDERDAREKELIAFRQKFKITEAKNQDQLNLIAKLREDLEAARVDGHKGREDSQRMTKEVDEMRGLYEDLQRTERVARVDLQEATKKYERFRNRVMQVAFSTPGIRAPDDEIQDDQLIEMLKTVIDERTEFYRKINEMTDSVKQASTAKADLGKTVNTFRNHLMQANDRLNSSGRLALRLRDEVTQLTAQPIDEILYPIKEALLMDLQQQFQWQQEIDLALEACGVNAKIATDSTATSIRNLLSRWESGLQERDRLKSRMGQLETNYREEVEQLTARLTADTESAVQSAVEKERIESAETQRRTIDEICATEAEKLRNLAETEEKKRDELQESIAQLQRSLVERQSEETQRSSETQSIMTQLAEREKTEEELRATLTRLEAERDEAMTSVANQVRQAELRARSEVEEYREASRQHAVTIGALEERLNKVLKQNKELQQELTDKKAQCTEVPIIHMINVSNVEDNPDQPEELTNQVTQLNNQHQQQQQQQVPEPKLVVQTSAELASLERAIVVLRQENASLKKQLQDNDEIIAGLKRDIAGAAARLSDVRGELTNGQKEQVDTLKMRIKAAEAALSEERTNLAQLLETYNRSKEELAEKADENIKFRQAAAKLKASLTDRDTRIRELEELVASEREKWASQLSRLEDDGLITNELTALGAQCRGERHEQIIQHQKEALTELRKKLKTGDRLQNIDPILKKAFGDTIPSHDQAVHQVVLLKKELAELRGKIAMDETRRVAPNLTAQASASLHVKNQNIQQRMREASACARNGNADTLGGRGGSESEESELMMQQSALRDTMDGFEVSEACFINLVRLMASSLEMESLPGLQTMMHLPRDEREKLQEERHAAAQTLGQRIRVLKERLTRKEELLLGYEQDLSRLKQAEELASRKDAQLESLVKDIRMKTEETELLRESLHRTKDMLNQEKRLNTAIKQKKPFIAGPDSLKSRPKPPFHCPPEDIFGSSAAKQKTTHEKLKRKDYEIRTLKTELVTRDKELCQVTSRMANMENSLAVTDGQGKEKLGLTNEGMFD